VLKMDVVSDPPVMSAETDTNRDPNDEGQNSPAIVTEEEPEVGISKGAGLLERSNMIPPESFVPLFDFVDELVDFEEDAGRINFSNPAKYVFLNVFGG
jgi:hypothetical protein